MWKEVDGGYGESTFIEIWVKRISPMMRRLARPYFRVGIILSVCLSEENTSLADWFEVKVSQETHTQVTPTVVPDNTTTTT